MEVSVETLSGLERKLTIQSAADIVDSAFDKRVQEMAKTMKINGFRNGKVPTREIKRRHGKALYQEVLDDAMRKAYFEALTQEKLSPAGMPEFALNTEKTGDTLEFTAVFEVYPEIDVQPFGGIKVKKLTAEINDTDIDKVIETIREQHKEWIDVMRPAADGDQLLIDYAGTVDGETFDGGTAEGSALELGSKGMIEGFEQGLEGAEVGEKRVLDLIFPEKYHSEELSGKAVQFAVTVNSIAEKKLPEVDDAFVKTLGVEGGVESFRGEVEKNMVHEKTQAEKKQIKDQILEGLLDLNTVDVPKASVQAEVQRLQQQMLQQFGGEGQQFDPSMLPADIFVEQAKKTAAIGLIVAEVVKKDELKADPAEVRTMIEEIAARYGQPEDVINWYYGNQEKLTEIESIVLEDTVITHILDKADVTEADVSYEELFKTAES